MNLNQLEYFVTAAETLNFTKAAEKCFISQTAMTLQIQNLEKIVGAPLFIRDRHHVELTSAGKVYLSEAKDILLKAEDAIKLARTVSEGIAGSITIGFAKGYEQTNFSQTLRDFKKAFPSISIRFLRDNSKALYEHLERGDCDVCFSVSPMKVRSKNINHRYLKSYPLYAVLYNGHPLADRTSLMYRDLAEEDFIVMQPQGMILDESEEFVLCYTRGGFIPNIVGAEREEETILLMVSAEMGIAVMPEYSVRYFLNAKDIKLVKLVKENDEPETIDFEISWTDNKANPAVGTFLDWTAARNAIE